MGDQGGPHGKPVSRVGRAPKPAPAARVWDVPPNCGPCCSSGFQGTRQAHWRNLNFDVDSSCPLPFRDQPGGGGCSLHRREAGKESSPGRRGSSSVPRPAFTGGGDARVTFSLAYFVVLQAGCARRWKDEPKSWALQGVPFQAWDAGAASPGGPWTWQNRSHTPGAAPGLPRTRTKWALGPGRLGAGVDVCCVLGWQTGKVACHHQTSGVSELPKTGSEEPRHLCDLDWCPASFLWTGCQVGGAGGLGRLMASSIVRRDSRTWQPVPWPCFTPC